MKLGIAFQLVDDALDYVADQATLGKTIGDDFREGKITLPVLAAFLAGDEPERAFWRRTIESQEQTDDDLDRGDAPDRAITTRSRPPWTVRLASPMKPRQRWTFSLTARCAERSPEWPIIRCSGCARCAPAMADRRMSVRHGTRVRMALCMCRIGLRILWRNE